MEFKFTIFIGNLPFDTKDEHLNKLFSPCGLIKYVRIIRDPKTHLGKGIAYVCFTDKESLQNSLLLNNS